MAIPFVFENIEQLNLSLNAMLQGWALLIVDNDLKPEERIKARENLLRAIYALEKVKKDALGVSHQAGNEIKMRP